jgi:camphor 5-monooxygenase
MPIVTFLNRLGMPESEASYLHDLSARTVAGQPGMVEAQMEVAEYIAALIREREANPGEDFVSHLVQAKVMDRHLTPDEKLTIVRLVVAGGLDTVICPEDPGLANWVDTGGLRLVLVFGRWQGTGHHSY